jgi:hypothetical protein
MEASDAKGCLAADQALSRVTARPAPVGPGVLRGEAGDPESDVSQTSFRLGLRTEAPTESGR